MAKHRANVLSNSDYITLTFMADAWDDGVVAADKAWAYGKRSVEENPYRKQALKAFSKVGPRHT